MRLITLLYSLVLLFLVGCSGRGVCQDEPSGWLPDRFVVGYYRYDNKAFIKDYKKVKKALKDYNPQCRSYLYGSNDFKVTFERDTFDWGHMEQFEPRDGFWIYEKGKEPLDLGYDELDTVVPKAKKYFNER